jgi:hypothetical protein
VLSSESGRNPEVRFAPTDAPVSLAGMRGVKKENLPAKTCPACQRPFLWRKKWARCWDEVRFCSDACRKGTPRGQAQKSPGSPG